MTRARLLLAAALVAGGFATAAPPASAMCSAVMFYVTGYCNPCNVVGAVVPVTCVE